MSISVITENAWTDILKIQEEAYLDIPPEDVDVLKSKWLSSPSTCAVYLENNEVILGYLLAHPWPSDIPPKLHEISPVTDSDNLYLHDLALANEARGKGIAKALVDNLIDTAKAQEYKKVLLVAVQNSGGFWEKFGFVHVPDADICPSYGLGAKLMLRELKT